VARDPDFPERSAAPGDADDGRGRSSELTRRRFLAASMGAAAAMALPLPSPALAAGGCDPLATKKRFRGVAPTPSDVLGFPLGHRREVTSAESADYLDAVAAATNRVITGTYGSSVEGRPLRYAMIGRPGNVAPAGLDSIRRAVEDIRDPSTTDRRVARLAATTPAFLWIIANVHGNEESGADAALEIVYELADREDCVVEGILDNAVVVVIPIQNPDGREADIRRNAYGFDLNRDMFARTQPESDSKVELMRHYPALALVDSHEFGYYQSFFPPDNDPIYHEVTDQTLHSTNDIFGRSFSNAFKREGWGFFHGKVYDFFSPEYNDTVSTNGFQAAGMTIEVPDYKPLSLRFLRHYTVDLIALAQGAHNKEALLRQQHRAFVQAVAEGTAGVLEPNERVFHPRKPVKTHVPDRAVRHYFILDEPGKRMEVQLLVRRLQRMNVVVHRLSADLAVPDFRPYARRPRAVTVPAGTYWVPMDQPQKHWIQMMLNEDTYQPTLFTYGMSGWSSPLLMNLDGGSSGQRLRPDASVVAPVAEPAGPTLPPYLPAVGVYQLSKGSFSVESAGSTRWLFDTRWRLPFTDLSADDIAGGALDRLDVLVVPGGGWKPAVRRLGHAGRRALVDWVHSGGRYVGYRGGGTRLAATLGLSTVRLSRAKADVPGSLIRARVDATSPLGAGVGPFVWVFFDDDFVMQVGDAPIRYPTAGSGDFFISGFARNEDTLYGTAAVSDEAAGRGRVVLFATDPTFQGMTEGMERILFNAILGNDPVRAASTAAGVADRASAVALARKAAEALPPWPWLSLSVESEAARVAESLLTRYGARFDVVRASGLARFAIANPDELSLEEHPFAIDLAIRLEQRGVRIVSFSA
jgi:Zinc carboxypeptidase